MPFGVDEAGKGPVLGSMFAAAVRGEPASLPADVGDSKDIPQDKREELAESLRAAPDIAINVAEIPVATIDDPETDMNGLTVRAHARALDEMARDGLAGTVDAGETNEDRFGRRVVDAVDATVSVTAAHGADASDPLVGAASICAKVARDEHVAALAEDYPDFESLGSGYPSDPDTRAFLRDYVDAHGELPPCARRSWQTSRDVLASAEQSGLSEF